MGLGLEPRRLLLFVECEEAAVLDLDQTLNLELPLDLQVTFSSTAGDRASKFTVSILTPHALKTTAHNANKPKHLVGVPYLGVIVLQCS